VKQAVLLLAFGAPERIEDVDPFLHLVRGGRPAPRELREQMRLRYQAIGGGSPLGALTRRQAEALAERLAGRGWPLPVYWAMRNWRPFIQETLARVKAEEVERLIVICLAPQQTRASLGLYHRRVEQAQADLGLKAELVWATGLHNHPLLVEAFAEKLSPLAAGRRVVFTAHSVPVRLIEGGDNYDEQARGTAAAVAERAGLREWDFAYQSQGSTDEAWLGPSVESVIDGYAQQGLREFVLAPISFVADNLEILYDVDIALRDYALRRGLRLLRPQSLNDSPTFIAALADIALASLRRG